MGHLDGIGARLRELRESRSMTQEHVAERLGVAKSAVSRMEKGERGVAAPELAMLASLFDVSADRILFGQKVGVLLRADGPADEAVAFAVEVVEDFEFLRALLA
jgi:transcriptional regulator with XRE-family HTH domain